jgi:hypothetical protein
MELLLLNQCTKDVKYEIIPVPIKNNSGIDLTRYRNIYLKKFTVDNTKGNKNLIFQTFIDDYFLNELPTHIDRNILPLPSEPVEQDNLIISGDLVLKILKSNVIRKVSGKKQFVKIENWSLELKMTVNQPGNKKPLLEETYKSSLKEVEADDPIYNFKTVFYRCCDNFSKDIFKREKMEQRYLLFK